MLLTPVKAIVVLAAPVVSAQASDWVTPVEAFPLKLPVRAVQVAPVPACPIVCGVLVKAPTARMKSALETARAGVNVVPGPVVRTAEASST
jgi:hypothetical protein